MVEQASSHKRIAWVVRELKSFAGIVLYLWVVFGLYVLNETIIMGKEHISFASHGFALINAVVLGKVLLVAEDMNFADRFKQGPLVFPIVYKAFAFSVLFVVFHVAESMLVGLFHGRRAIESFPYYWRWHTERYPVCHCDYFCLALAVLCLSGNRARYRRG